MDPQGSNRSLESEALSIINQHTADHSTIASRATANYYLNEQVRLTFGSKYSVVDISASTYLGLHTTQAPLELCIVDAEGKIFASPVANQVTKAQHNLYDYMQEALNAALQGWGYPVKSHPPYPSAIYDAFVPPISIIGPTCNLSLHAPSPFHLPLNRLFQAYTQLLRPLRFLIPLLDIWVDSLGLRAEFSPSCIALMTIAYLQQASLVPNLQSENATQSIAPDGVWWKEMAVDPQSKNILPLTLWYDFRLVQASPLPRTATFRDILLGWFEFWSGKSLRAFQHSRNVCTVRPTRPMLRQTTKSPQQRVAHVDLVRVGTEMDGVTPLRKPMFSELYRPQWWTNAPLIVQDPFFVTHNHAHTVTSNGLDSFLARSRLVFANLQRGVSLQDALFNAKLRPEPVLQELDVEGTSLNPELDREIQHIYMQHRPSIADLARRQHTIQKVARGVQLSFGDGYTVHCFGSTQYGVDSSSSDLDMVIVDLNRPNGFAPSVNTKRLPNVYKMRQLGIALALHNPTFTDVIPISKATVPIVKFYDSETGIHVDLNCNETIGRVNTGMLSVYCGLYPPLRPMLFVIKKWAKSLGFNDPSGTSGPPTLSSYALSLMAIGYLQTRGILPNLQKSAVGHVDPETDGFWLRTLNDERVWCDTRYADGKGWQTPPLSLSEAVHGWFRYWGFSHFYQDSILDISRGGVFRRQNPYDATASYAFNRRRPTKRTKRQDGGPSTIPSSSKVDIIQPSDIGNAQAEEHLAQMMADADLDDALKTEAAADELSGEQKQDGEAPRAEPQQWKGSLLVVVDPFVSFKCLTSNCDHDIIVQFSDECQRAASLLESGESMASLIEDGGTLVLDSNRKARKPNKPLKATQINAKANKMKAGITSITDMHVGSQAPVSVVVAKGESFYVRGVPSQPVLQPLSPPTSPLYSRGQASKTQNQPRQSTWLEAPAFQTQFAQQRMGGYAFSSNQANQQPPLQSPPPLRRPASIRNPVSLRSPSSLHTPSPHPQANPTPPLTPTPDELQWRFRLAAAGAGIKFRPSAQQGGAGLN